MRPIIAEVSDYDNKMPRSFLRFKSRCSRRSGRRQSADRISSELSSMPKLTPVAPPSGHRHRDPPMPKGTSSSPGAPPPETPDVLPRPDFHFQGEIGRTYRDSDPAQFPQPVAAPKGAPNVLLVLIDDCGFGQYGTFGGGIPSPTMDKLAAEGLRYNRFHTTALCSPTRAALITGRNHHSTSFPGITELATASCRAIAGRSAKCCGRTAI
jgi:hypothetical protein